MRDALSRQLRGAVIIAALLAAFVALVAAALAVSSVPAQTAPSPAPVTSAR